MNLSIGLGIEEFPENPRTNTDLNNLLVIRQRKVNNEKISKIKRIMREKPMDHYCANLGLICLIIIINNISENAMSSSFSKLNPKTNLKETLEPIYISYLFRSVFALCAGE